MALFDSMRFIIEKISFDSLEEKKRGNLIQVFTFYFKISQKISLSKNLTFKTMIDIVLKVRFFFCFKDIEIMTHMSVRVGDASTYVQIPNKKVQLLLTQFREVDVYEKTFREVINQLLGNGPKLIAQALDVTINDMNVSVMTWDSLFILAVLEAVKNYKETQLSSTRPFYVTIIFRRRKQFFVPNATLKVETDPRCEKCRTQFKSSNQFSVSVNLKYDTVVEVEELIREFVEPTTELIVCFNGKKLGRKQSEKRSLPLIWLGLTDGAQIVLHIHPEESLY
jgi:hypothetical protein